MKLDDLNRTNRRCDSRLVRQCVAIERGRSLTLSPETWARYRKLCGVPSKARQLTDREAFMLVVCAAMHKQGQRVDKWRLTAECDRRLEQCADSASKIQRMTASTIKAVELPNFLRQLTGRSLSLRTLYRWGQNPAMPRFSLEAEYNAAQLQRWIQAAA